MDIKKFLKWKNLFIIFLAVILIGILISKQSYIANPNHDMKDIPVFKEISLNQYEETLKSVMEETVKIEDIESLLMSLGTILISAKMEYLFCQNKWR